MKYIITQEQLQVVLNYLGTRPYIEVAKLILTLGQLQQVPVDSDKKNESAKIKK
jgi:hypothetical protein|tara:strand:- start:405 stop:566 length:162 start_codon:yes stop_codon:yes gene_type:complete